MNLSEDFWDAKYKSNKTGWDLGEISAPLKNYFDQLTNKELKILIPGGGNSYEAEYLFNIGFRNVYVIDLSSTAIENIQKRIPDFPKEQLLHANFFDLEETFDLVIEQTFFCAINPELRTRYALKMNEILHKKGKIVGLFFDTELNTDHPPFGGNGTEYKTYFAPYFEIEIFEACYNSTSSRKDMELFAKFVKQ